MGSLDFLVDAPRKVCDKIPHSLARLCALRDRINIVWARLETAPTLRGAMELHYSERDRDLLFNQRVGRSNPYGFAGRETQPYVTGHKPLTNEEAT